MLPASAVPVTTLPEALLTTGALGAVVSSTTPDTWLDSVNSLPVAVTLSVESAVCVLAKVIE